MSNSLVRKSLNLVAYEIENKEGKGKTKKKKHNRGTLDLIPANYRIVKSKNKRATVHEAKKILQSKGNPVQENIKKLLALSGSKSDISDKGADRGAYKFSTLKKKKSVEEEPTAFTEEDFKNFEAEYTGD